MLARSLSCWLASFFFFLFTHENDQHLPGGNLVTKQKVFQLISVLFSCLYTQIFGIHVFPTIRENLAKRSSKLSNNTLHSYNISHINSKKI